MQKLLNMTSNKYQAYLVVRLSLFDTCLKCGPYYSQIILTSNTTYNSKFFFTNYYFPYTLLQPYNNNNQALVQFFCFFWAMDPQ